MERDKRERLVTDGFCVFGDVLPPDLLVRLRTATDRLVAAQTAEQVERQRTTGSMINVMSAPALAELIALPAALAALQALGYGGPSFSDGWIISKPGRGPRLFWHYDWFAWEDPASHRLEPLQLALMYYLHDTRPENGCLRVIPGSHVNHNPLHDVLATPRQELSAGIATNRAEFDDRPDEVDVPIRAGDLLVTDARLLHAGHANRTDERRTLITLWYQPDLAAMPERIQAQMGVKTHQPGPDWPAEAVALVAPLLTRYDGDAEPYPRTLYRPPLAER
ncbi:MAG: phytanoyl-CoA dioxygenase family protein [Micromonosporaceae bacterium]